VRAIDLARQHPSGRLDAIVSPGQVDCSTPERLRDAFVVAEERNLAFQLHTAESVIEFHEMQRRHGLTSVGWLEQLGVLSDRTTLGHAIFLDHHPWLHWTSRRDLALLAERGVSVAHCPTVFMRRGVALNTFGGYVRAGVNIGIGTDTYPHNMLDEMRHAGTVARAVAGSVDDLDTSDVFNAATVGGARSLMRDDIGRLEVGARADFVLVDLKHPAMMPAREPLRNLIFVANDRAVRDVYVDGRRVVANGEVLTIDHRAACEELAEVQARAIRDIPKRDWAGRSADELMPLVYPVTS
jgi:cytosine/adenosine deaminase-related metal-dependent hydrolase